MPPKKTTAAPSEKADVSERLELAKAISNMSSKADSFLSAVETFHSFSKDMLTKLDLDIESRKLELDDLKKQIEHSIKNGKIDVAVALKEYRREGAVEMLQGMGETVIPAKELDTLRSEFQVLKDQFDTMVKAVRKEEVEKRDEAISSAIRNMELKYKAENAMVNALSEQREREIATLKSNIVDLKSEISAQRELTKSVAEAGRHTVQQVSAPR
uniref:Uncharacterized protein n=1 Tax=viral metagenome TaxID=1070528 RepID=A0A6C0JWA7_9ZZZZ